MPNDPQPNPWRFAHMGMEFAGAALVMALLGYYIDSRMGSRPWGAVIGAAVGFTGGMYLFIKEALRANRMYAKDKSKPNHKQADDNQPNND